MTSSSLPLLLTVRFSSSHPDIDLSIPSPGATPTAALKLLIRAQLPASYAQRRLRFIHRGRVLDDSAALSLVVPPVVQPPPPPPQKHQDDEEDGEDQDEDGDDDGDDNDGGRGRRRRSTTKKGKGKARDMAIPLPPRVILNCAIGTADAPLTSAELANESRIAHLPPTAQAAFASTASASPASRPEVAPRGFDRLAAAGLSRAEIAQLRTHFVALQARRHTPDEMPSPDSMRRIEDAWIDGNVTGAPAAAAATTANNNDVQAMMLEDDEASRQFGVLDGLVGGMAAGFFFPVGVMVWALREGGMLTYHRSLYVVLGLVLAVATGIMRGFSGDDDGR